MIAATVGIGLGFLERSGTIHGAWRWEFLSGAIPAPLAFIVFRKLKEPEQWLKARAEKKQLGSYTELLSDSRWRRNSIIGLTLSVAGVVGLWGIGYFSYDLFQPVLMHTFAAEGLSGAALSGKTTTWIGITSMFQNLGGFFGVYAFTYLTHYTGRRTAFQLSFLTALGVTAFTFWNLHAISDIFWMVPLMGFSQMTLFGGYAIYLPELFPTRLRSTGTSFCYNVGRAVAALGPFTFGYLTSSVFASHVEPMRYAGCHHESGVSDRSRRAAVRARNQGPAAARVAGSHTDTLKFTAWRRTRRLGSIWRVSGRSRSTGSASSGSPARSSGSMRRTCNSAACPRPRFSSRSAPHGSRSSSRRWAGPHTSTAPAMSSRPLGEGPYVA